MKVSCDLMVSPASCVENARKILRFSNVKGILFCLEMCEAQTESRL